MIEWINKLGKIDLTCRRNPNSMCRYSTLEEVGDISPLSNCGLCIVTFFQTKINMGSLGKKVNLTMEKPDGYSLKSGYEG